jgi:anti-sigma factor RsiW
MTCRNWEERIALHAGGDLPAAETAALEAHLAECEECRGAAGAYSSGFELLREAHGGPINAAHYTAVRTRVMAELGRERVWRRILVCGVVAAAATVVLLLWPLAVRAPEPIRLAAYRPAPPAGIEVSRPAAPVRARHPAVHPAKRAPEAPLVHAVSEPEKQPAEPLMVKMLTDDPNVIIYWIAD